MKESIRTKSYDPLSYKKEPVKSLDWASVKAGPSRLDPPKLKKDFVKVDYLRFESKKEAENMISSQPYNDLMDGASKMVNNSATMG